MELNNSIFITGASGFVAKNMIAFLANANFTLYNRNEPIIVKENILLHFAGKAHDLRNTSNSAEYYQVNTDLSKRVFDAFLISDATVFITLSSVKAVADELESDLTEEHYPNPITNYGKSKLLAEQYILSKKIPAGKRVYVLRPCMIHGAGNKGNLNLLFRIVRMGMPWPLGSYENKRSFCSIDNLCFIVQELIENENILSGIYNVADDEPLSTNELIKLIADSQGKKTRIWNLPQSIINSIAKFGDLIRLPLNTERLKKLTESYVVRNAKIKTAINKPLPMSCRDGLMKTLKSFNSNA